MRALNTRNDCQIYCLQRIDAWPAHPPTETLLRRVKLTVRRHLSPSRERSLKRISNDWIRRIYSLLGRNTRPAVPVGQSETPHLQAGDTVRVRSKAEIDATLNYWRQLRGCTFMPEMAQYCETTQRVLKPMRRFVDERDLRVKKCSGIVLLEGIG